MSKRSPLTPAERKQILKMHGDGYTQLMIANQVGVHRHSVANVLAKAGDATPAELRAENARLKVELVKRDAEVLALRRGMGAAPSVAAALRPVLAVARAVPSAAGRRAQSTGTPPRDPPDSVSSRGLTAMSRWYALEKERQSNGYPLPDGPYHGWTEVQMRYNFADAAASFHP